LQSESAVAHVSVCPMKTAPVSASEQPHTLSAPGCAGKRCSNLPPLASEQFASESAVSHALSVLDEEGGISVSASEQFASCQLHCILSLYEEDGTISSQPQSSCQRYATPVSAPVLCAGKDGAVDESMPVPSSCVSLPHHRRLRARQHAAARLH
jgi:hypothetical protein